MEKETKDTKELEKDIESLRAKLDKQHRENNKKNEDLSRCISLWCWLVVVGLVVAFVLLVLIIFLPGAINIPRKEFVVSVISVIFVAVFVLLFLSRKNPYALIALISMGLCIACFSLGLVAFGIGKSF